MITKALQEFVSELQKNDPSVAILPFYKANDGQSEIIFDQEDILPYSDKTRQYFANLYPNAEGKRMYTAVYIGGNKTFAFIKSEASLWLRSKDWGLYLREVQADMVTNIV